MDEKKNGESIIVDEDINNPYKYLDKQIEDHFENIQTEEYGEKKENLKGTKKVKNKREKKGLTPETAKIVKLAVIFLGVALIIVALGVSCSSFTKNLGLSGSNSNEESAKAADFGHDYIGVLHIDGTISENSGSESLLGGSSSYDHQFTLDSIDQLIDDDNNKGLILEINTPGGSVYASDELYFKIKEYQKKTGRPVYSAMGSQATSGGYYISAPCDKIVANRNCWTGSIGVTIGTVYDISGLLDKLGINTVTITSGANKAMGSETAPLTQEQKEIFQSLVDESYEQFVDIVADGRHMSKLAVKKLADGRIYTAKQALKNKLIDKIGTLKEAAADMAKTYNFGDISIEDIVQEKKEDIGSLLFSSLRKSDNALSDIDRISALMDLNDKFTVTYMSTVEK